MCPSTTTTTTNFIVSFLRYKILCMLSPLYVCVVHDTYDGILTISRKIGLVFVMPSVPLTSDEHTPNETTSFKSKYAVPQKLHELPAPVLPLRAIAAAAPLNRFLPFTSIPKLKKEFPSEYSSHTLKLYHPLAGTVNIAPDAQFQLLNVVELYAFPTDVHTIVSYNHSMELVVKESHNNVTL